MSYTKQMLKNTLESSFDLTSWTNFVKELLCGCELMPQTKEIVENQQFSKYIKSFTHIAKYSDNEDSMIVLAVELLENRTAERGRSTQRSFVSKLIKNSEYKYKSALVAFYNPNESIWRISFVEVDNVYKNNRLNDKITPVKRYSFIVGEPCHTAESRLYDIINAQGMVSISKIKDAFSVEKVTKDFIKEYTQKYVELKAILDKDEEFIKEAERGRVNNFVFSFLSWQRI